MATNNFIDNSKTLFRYYKDLGDKTFEQLSEKDIHFQYNEQSNSIAIIVNHLQGNMKSRWTDFLTADGEKEWRQRDQEFDAIIETKAQMLAAWVDGWSCLFQALDSINHQNFDKAIYIRNKEHTILEAVQRQLAHYAYHVGQILFIVKMIKGEEWKYLSIAKGESKAYNQANFEKGKRKEHFTQEWINKK